MGVIFLTSSLGNYHKTINGKEAIKTNNSNHFIDRLKKASDKLPNVVFVASDPDDNAKSVEYSNLIVKSLNLDDFEIKHTSIINHDFKGDISKTIADADCVFLMGGNVPKQNKFFKEINLKEILKKYNGIIIGQSAGSMNCGQIVYTQPEEDYEFEDNNYKRIITGLGLTAITIMPHMNNSDKINDNGYPSVMQMCLEDSYSIPHYGIVDYGFIEIKDNKIYAFGETYQLTNGKCLTICKNGEMIDLNEFENTKNLEK